METYEIIIKPITGFGTPLKGDTLFGHVCWQSVYDEGLFGMNINKLLADYVTEPFLVISSAYPILKDAYVLKRPDMPLDMLFDFGKSDASEIIKERKKLKAKRWMIVERDKHIRDLKSSERLLAIANCQYLNDEELFERISISKDVEAQRQMRKRGVKSFVTDYTQPHNTINRLTGTTGEAQFAPYTVDQSVYMPETELVIFAGLRRDIKIEQLVTTLRRIGQSGFGKDASTGLGRFEVIGHEKIDLSIIGSEKANACYTLAPCVPEKGNFDKVFFTPFVRFGRHGDVLAKLGKPFKNPIIMADEGAVFLINNPDTFKKPYIGTAVLNVSKAESNTVSQGYSLYIPIRVEGVNG